MFYTHFMAQNGLTRLLAARLLAGGLVLALIGLLVLLFPMLVASVVAAMCFVAASALLGGAWKVYRASSSFPSVRAQEKRFEDAVWREMR